MLGMRQHHAAIPESLIHKYYVSSEDVGRLAAMLTPEDVRFFLDNEGVSAEYHSGSILITPSLISKPENYELAVQRAHAFAQQLGMKEGEMN